MSADPVRALESALGADALVAPGARAEWALGGAVPEAVVQPRSLEEVGAVLRAAAAGGFSVVPLGGRTDPGAEPPRAPFVALSTLRLEGVEDYEPADLTVTVRAGTSLGSLERLLAEQGQWLPADPPRAPERTVGGLVATGAAGPLGTAFGRPRDHVLGLTIVTGDARVLRLGGRVMKNVAGFDLVRLVVGSRGTLGVVTAATFRVFPRPTEDRAVVVRADRPGALLDAARRVATAGVVPASAVLVNPAPASGGAALVVRVQGAPGAVDADTTELLGEAEPEATVLRGDDARRLHQAVRDHASGHALVVRAFALPGLLPEVLGALHDALPVAALAADVMSGRIRAGLEGGSPVDPGALESLRARLEALGGTLVLERASPSVLSEVPAYGPGGRAGMLGDALRARFDPGGVLSAGRFTA